MITRTSFNRQLLAKIDSALREAARNSKVWSEASGWPVAGQAYVSNRHMQIVLRVDHRRGEPSAWRFWDKSQRDITDMVLAALREGAHARPAAGV